MAASSGEITRRIAEIQQEMDAISLLKNDVEDDVWAHSMPVRDFDDVELSERNLQARIREMALEIAQDYQGKRPVLVGLLDGAVPFCQALSAELGRLLCSHDITWVQVSSYGTGMTSGTLYFGAMPKVSLAGRDVIIVDDVCDTGQTLDKTRRWFLEELHAKTVYTAVLVDKVQERENRCTPNLSGFRVSASAFIIGFGLDYCGSLLRSQKSIRAAHPDHHPSSEKKAQLDAEKGLIMELETLHRQRQELQATTAPGVSSGQTVQSFFADRSAALPSSASTAPGLSLQ